MLKQAACIKLINQAWLIIMACLNLMEMFKGKKVKVEVEQKKGPGRPKTRFDLEPAMAVGSHPEAVGFQEVAVESANSAVVAVEQQEVVGPLDMADEGVIAELPAAVKLSSREYGLLGQSTALR